MNQPVYAKALSSHKTTHFQGASRDICHFTVWFKCCVFCYNVWTCVPEMDNSLMLVRHQPECHKSILQLIITVRYTHCTNMNMCICRGFLAIKYEFSIGRRSLFFYHWCPNQLHGHVFQQAGHKKADRQTDRQIDRLVVQLTD